LNRYFRLLKLSLVIATMIFLIAVLSEFAVRMYYSSEEIWVKILASFIAIVLIAVPIVILFLTNPRLRQAILRIFEVEEEN